MNAGVIPIDNRPVCYQLVEQISKLDSKNKIYLPDINLTGGLNSCADGNALTDWVNSLTDIDVLILSLDTIAYGGLIPSRRSCDDFNIIKTRIDNFFEIVTKKKIKVYAFSSIMRISNNNVNEEEKEYWNLYGKKIFQYSYNTHKAEKQNKEYKNTEIPQDILEDYLMTRKRNFEINKYYIELTRQNLIDTLVFSKDDCGEFGLNVREGEELSLLAKDMNNVIIKTGADEIPLALLSRALNRGKNIKIFPLYLNKNGIDKISKYEDISVKQSTEAQIRLCGGIISDYANADMVLLVNNFETQQGELVMNVDVPLFKGEIKLPEKPYFVADILNANGADNNFVKELLKNPLNDNFYGYSAWNTTGNTLGCALAVALTYFRAEKKNQMAFNLLQTVRFLDDWAYQANVRKEIREDNKNLINGIIKIEMKKYEDIILKKFATEYITPDYYFPWKRFFEIGINLELN